MRPSPNAVRIKPPEPAGGPGPPGLDIPVHGVGPEALDAFLRSDRSPPDGLQLSGLDGLLTGLAVGPEPIMPSEWLPLVWGGEDPVFGDDEEARAVLGGVMSRYHQIVRQVADGTFQPILGTDPDGDLVATGWAEGFALAISLRSHAWAPMARSKRHALLLLPVMVLSSGPSGLGFDPASAPDFMRGAAETIPDCVVAIDEFWRARRTRSGVGLTTERTTGPARFAAKPGRNDPCPCGSGKKFKKCCGP